MIMRRPSLAVVWKRKLQMPDITVPVNLYDYEIQFYCPEGRI
jgi:hypothetical protein